MIKQDKVAGSVDGWIRPGLLKTGLLRTPGELLTVESQNKNIFDYLVLTNVALGKAIL